MTDLVKELDELALGLASEAVIYGDDELIKTSKMLSQAADRIKRPKVFYRRLVQILLWINIIQFCAILWITKG